MVNRGPQLVQLMNGYRWRRSAGSASSRRQSAQVAVSGETSVWRSPPARLSAIANPDAPVGSSGVAVTRSITARGGASAASASRNRSTVSAAPSTSTNTPPASLPTSPASPSRPARACTNGRNPTPCTIPSTRTRVRVSVIVLAAYDGLHGRGGADPGHPRPGAGLVRGVGPRPAVAGHPGPLPGAGGRGAGPADPGGPGGRGLPPVPGAVPRRPRPGRGRPGRGAAGLAGPRLQPPRPGSAGHRPGGGGTWGLAGHGRGAGRPPRRRPLYGPGGGLLRPRPAGRPGGHQRGPGPGQVAGRRRPGRAHPGGPPAPGRPGPPARGRGGGGLRRDPRGRPRPLGPRLDLVVGPDGRRRPPLPAPAPLRRLPPGADLPLADPGPGRAAAPAKGPGPVRHLRPALARRRGPGPGRRLRRPGPGRPGRRRPGGRRRAAGRLVRRPPGPPGGRGDGRHRRRRPPAPTGVSWREWKGAQMAESKAAWDQVGQEFRALGRQVKQHYEESRPEKPGTPLRGSLVDKEDGEETAEPRAESPTTERRKVDDALQKLTESLDQAFSAIGDAVRDPQVGEQTRKAASSLSDALNATFAEASERFRKR